MVDFARYLLNPSLLLSFHSLLIISRRLPAVTSTSFLGIFISRTDPDSGCSDQTRPVKSIVVSVSGVSELISFWAGPQLDFSPPGNTRIF